MALKQIEFTADFGRDNGRKFIITEMPAAKAESFAFRVFLALTKNDFQMPENIENAGFAALAELGISALRGLNYEDVEPLFNEMMSCVRYKMSDGSTRDLFESDIEELVTRLKIRAAWWGLHADFLKAVVSQT